MPKPNETDWELIKVLWLQGFTPAQIMAKTGAKVAAIKSRAYRYKWNELKGKTEAILKTEAKASLTLQVAKDLAEQSKRAKEELSAIVDCQIQLLKKHPAKSLSQLSGKNGVASTTQTIVNTTSKLYGWDSQSGRSLIHIGTLNQLKLMDDSVTDSSCSN